MKSNESEFTITRKFSSNTSSYYISDKKVTKTQVQNLLMRYGIDLSFPERFIILQHNTVQIAHKKPLELLEHLEKLIGTYNLKEEIDEMNKKIEEKYQEKSMVQEKVFEIEDKMKELSPRIEKFNEYIEEVEKYENEMKDYQSKCKEYSKVVLDDTIEEIKQKLAQKREMEEEKEKNEAQLKNLKFKRKEKEKEVKKLQNEYLEIEKNFQNISKAFTFEKVFDSFYILV